MDLKKLGGKVLQREIEKEKSRLSSVAEEQKSKRANALNARGQCTHSFWTTYENRDKLRAILPDVRTDSARVRLALEIFITAAETANEPDLFDRASLDWADG